MYDKQNEQVERILERARHEILAIIGSIEPETQDIERDPALEPLVTIKVASAHLGISESQLRALEKKGQVPAYRPGGVLRFDLAELREAVRAKQPNVRDLS